MSRFRQLNDEKKFNYYHHCEDLQRVEAENYQYKNRHKKQDKQAVYEPLDGV